MLSWTERDVAIAYVGAGEVIGAHSLEGLGVVADPIQKKLVPTVMLALGLRENS
jgi:hypothetical protein